VTHLAAKAQHHMTCVQKVEGHLAGLDKSSDDKERCVCVVLCGMINQICLQNTKMLE